METILIVEDNNAATDILYKALLIHSFSVSFISTGIQAIKLAPSLQPSLIILDIQLPEIDGIKTCSILKANEITKNIPVIFYTSQTCDDLIAKAYDVGAVDFIRKPTEAEELICRIKKHLEYSNIQQILKLDNDALQQSNLELVKRIAQITHDLEESHEQLQTSFIELFIKSEQLKRSEKQIKYSEERLKHITSSVTDYIYKVDIENSKEIRTTHNLNCHAILGYTADELNNNKYLWNEIVYIEDRSKVQDFFQKFLTSNENDTIEYRIIHRNGSCIWVSNTVIAYLDSRDKLVCYEGIIKNISERKQLENQLLISVIETEEKERQRFAQEIHDGISPILSAIKMYLSWMKKDHTKVDIQKISDDTLQLVDDAHSALREITNNLSPNLLINFGLEEALKVFIQNITRTNQLNIRFLFENSLQLNLTTQTIIYRAITESINNTIKYAKASEIIIYIKNEANSLIINYQDNGDGFDVPKTIQTKQGNGLLNISNRIKSINGILQITSNKGEGVLINITIPISN